MADSEEQKELKRLLRANEDKAIVIVESAENSENMVISPLLAVEKSRGWQPGQSGNPKGRPRKEIERAYMDAAIDALTPAEYSQLLRGLCFHPTSWRAQAAGLKIVGDLSIGLPAQRVIHEDSALQGILEAIHRARNVT